MEKITRHHKRMKKIQMIVSVIDDPRCIAPVFWVGPMDREILQKLGYTLRKKSGYHWYITKE